MPQEPPDTIEGHYSASARHDAVMAAVRQALPLGQPYRVADLAPLDQFHLRGAAATEELAALARITADMTVLDVGSGIGGPARYLAATFGCRVTGIDLSAEYCRIAGSLTALAGLTDNVSFRTGDACHMPFPDASFDLVWTQHVVMNIADRRQLYTEMHRVLRPGGKVAMYDVVQGDGAPLQFPVPWARLPENSALLDPAATRSVLEQCGFSILNWLDVSDAAKAWLVTRPPAPPPSTLGLHLLMGPDFAGMTRNYAQNLAAGRVGLAMAIAQA